jgi:hypothetical protein
MQVSTGGRFVRTLLGFFALLLSASTCISSPITFTFEGTGSGTLAGQAFSNTAFLITAQADTSNANCFSTSSTGCSLSHTSAKILLSGLGEHQFTSSTRTFVNNTNTGAGFSRGVSDGVIDLFTGFRNPALATWKMTESIGPITANAQLVQWSNPTPILTSGGTLNFTNATVLGTFTARVVPEPSTLLLALAGFSLLGIRRR